MLEVKFVRSNAICQMLKIKTFNIKYLMSIGIGRILKVKCLASTAKGQCLKAKAHWQNSKYKRSLLKC